MSRIALLLAFVASPALADEPARGPAEEFYPTRVGTHWVMRWTFTDGSDPVQDVVGVTDEKIVNGYRKWRVRVVTGPVAKNPLVAIIKALTNPREVDEVFDAWEYYDVGEEAYVSKGVEEEDELPFPLLYYPAKEGDVFTDPDGLPITVVAGKQKVKVPAGTFDCIVYEVDYTEGALETVSVRDDAPVADPAPPAPNGNAPSDDAPKDAAPKDEGFDEDGDAFDPTITREYWSKGVGLVKVEEFDVSEGGRKLVSTQELISFHVPKK